MIAQYLCTYSVASPGESYCIMHLTLGKSKPLAATSVEKSRADFSVLKDWKVFLRSSWSMFPCKRNILQPRNICLISASDCGWIENWNSLNSEKWKSTASHVEKNTTICEMNKWMMGPIAVQPKALINNAKERRYNSFCWA